MRAYFITGTGTGVGKTWFACALIRHWRHQHFRVAAFKPIMSGYDTESCEASDAGLLLQELGRPVTEANLDNVAPWRFHAPLSPDMAAADEGRCMSFTELIGFSNEVLRTDADAVLIEGVGGCMVPLDDEHTVRDWMVALNIPAILVSGSYLGALSHTLTAYESLRERNVSVAAVVVNETLDSSVPIMRTVESLRAHCSNVSIWPVSRSQAYADVAGVAAQCMASR